MMMINYGWALFGHSPSTTPPSLLPGTVLWSMGQ